MTNPQKRSETRPGRSFWLIAAEIHNVRACLMGIFAGLFFLGGLAVSLMLMAWGIAAHRKTTAANGQDNSWFRFGLLSVGLTLATIIVTALLLFPGNHAGAPTGNDYIGMLLLAGLLGASPGVGVRLASSVMRSPQEEQEQEQEQRARAKRGAGARIVINSSGTEKEMALPLRTPKKWNFYR